MFPDEDDVDSVRTENAPPEEFYLVVRMDTRTGMVRCNLDELEDEGIPGRAILDALHYAAEAVVYHLVMKDLQKEQVESSDEDIV
jgi:hypothetical protein